MNTLINDDMFNVLPTLESKSVDLIFADLPYGTTNVSWDQKVQLNYHINGLGFDQTMLKLFKGGKSYDEALTYWNENKVQGLWQHYERIIKDDGVILLYAQTPFDKELGESNRKLLRYEWIWEKTQGTGHLNSKKMPMKYHENILVFYKNKPSGVKNFKRTYNPQMTSGHVRKISSAKNRGACINRRNGTDNIYNKEYSDKVKDYNSTDRFPKDVITFKTDKQTSNLHKTQKPLALTEYMIKTYTNEGDLVLDNCAGSLVVAEACKNLGRDSICIEKDTSIFENSVKERKLG